jgi:hypothetical protein
LYDLLLSCKYRTKKKKKATTLLSYIIRFSCCSLMSDFNPYFIFCFYYIPEPKIPEQVVYPRTKRKNSEF